MAERYWNQTITEETFSSHTIQNIGAIRENGMFPLIGRRTLRTVDL
jgi:hypothetical protein